VATLGGKHTQARTGRELTCWCAYELVGEANLSYVAVVNQGRNYLGQREATLHYDPYSIPARSFVRRNLLKYLDQQHSRRVSPRTRGGSVGTAPTSSASGWAAGMPRIDREQSGSCWLLGRTGHTRG
jgi:hypothetical protein